jgi:hypothetical protein
MALRIIELVLGWLAVILASAVGTYIYLGGFIAPFAVEVDLIGFGVILLALAVGVTTDGIFNFFPGRILLALATLVYTGIAVTSFILFLLPSIPLATFATVIAFIRPFIRPHGVSRHA